MTGVILESNVICGLDKTMSITLSIRSGGDGNGSGSYPEPGYDYATVVSEAMGHIERSYGGISGTENHTEKLDLISPEERAVHSYFRQQLVRYLLISSGINSENFEPDCFDYDNTGLLLPFEAREDGSRNKDPFVMVDRSGRRMVERNIGLTYSFTVPEDEGRIMLAGVNYHFSRRRAKS